MSQSPRIGFVHSRVSIAQARWARPTAGLLAILLIAPIAAHAQAGGTPFDTGFTAIQTLFTGTIAKVASLVAIVIGGYAFAHGEPGAKNSRFGYVSISRASRDVALFTDDSSRLSTLLSSDSSKTSALEMAPAAPLSQGIGMSI
jgi:type IV secretory pathway VirB2 component (pilin)